MSLVVCVPMRDSTSAQGQVADFDTKRRKQELALNRLRLRRQLLGKPFPIEWMSLSYWQLRRCGLDAEDQDLKRWWRGIHYKTRDHIVNLSRGLLQKRVNKQIFKRP